MTRAQVFPWHDVQWQQLATARRNGRLPHAILLSGAAGLGKAAFARRLSNALVCTDPDDDGDACGRCSACRQASASSHPDQHLIAPEEAGKMIKIGAIRELSSKSVLAAQEGGYRVFTIDPAEAMNRAAANALLKTLEEPVSRSLLILVSSSPHRLPATIRSRCQALSFRTPDAAVAAAWLGERLDSDTIDGLLAISGGAPVRALQAAEEDWLGQGGQLCGELAALRSRKSHPLQIVEDWQKRPLTLLIDSLKRCISDLIRLGTGSEGIRLFHPALHRQLQSLCQGIDLGLLFGFNDDLLALERAASNNLNEQMQLEHLVNRWLQITRPGGQ